MADNVPDDPALQKAEAEAPPTRVRYGVLGYLCSLAFILYLDRICINKVAPDIERELDISHTAMGFVFGAFTIAYGLFEVPTGRWGDRYGSRGVLMRIVIWWSVFTVLTGCVWKFTLNSGYEIYLPWGGAVPLLFNSFMLLLLIRFLFGAGEAGAFPNAARVISRWFPPNARGPAQGIINTSALIGGAVAPVVVAYVSEYAGWRWSFVIFGLLGVVWAIAFYLWFREDPAQHPHVNEAERRLVASGSPPALQNGNHPPVPWRHVLTSGNVWLLGGVITCTAFAAYLYFSWYPTYLEKGRGVDSKLSGWLSGIVLAGGAVGATLGGYVRDVLVRRTKDRLRSTRLIGFAGLSIAGLSLLTSVQCDSPVAAALFTALACLSGSATLASWWSVVTDISGQHIGSLFGLLNSLGVPGAFASQIFVGSFVDWMRNHTGYVGRAQWDPAFYVYAAVLLLGAFGWLFVDPRKSAVGPEGDARP